MFEILDEPQQQQPQQQAFTDSLTTTTSSLIDSSNSGATSNLSALLNSSSSNNQSSHVTADSYRFVWLEQFVELVCVDAWQLASETVQGLCALADHFLATCERALGAYSFEARVFFLLLAIILLVNVLSGLAWRLFAANIRSYYANQSLFERIDEIRPNIIYCERKLSSQAQKPTTAAPPPQSSTIQTLSSTASK